MLYFWGMVWFLMWWNRCGIYEDNDGEDEEEDEGGMREAGEDTPLRGERRNNVRSLDGSGTDEGRFRVLLKGVWRDGAVTGGNAAGLVVGSKAV